MTKTKTEKTEVKKEEKLTIDKNKLMLVYQAIGRRRESTCRVKLFVVPSGEVTLKNKVVKKGEIMVNWRSIEQYFPGEINKKIYMEPFKTTNSIGRFAVSALISGGGPQGQLNAFIHGVSRALEKVDKEKFRAILKPKGFLTRDDRKKQRHKAGFAQKSRAKKQSPKR
jgi:small subunit ribosomal protein S9